VHPPALPQVVAFRGLWSRVSVIRRFSTAISSRCLTPSLSVPYSVCTEAKERKNLFNGGRSRDWTLAWRCLFVLFVQQFYRNRKRKRPALQPAFSESPHYGTYDTYFESSSDSARYQSASCKPC
jgi:hypothetical protein